MWSEDAAIEFHWDRAKDRLRVLVVVWSLRGDAIRVITARAADKSLRAAYFRRKGLYDEAH